MKIFITCLILVYGFSISLKAQYSETITTSRPGQAFVPFTTGKKVFQLQSGFTRTGIENDDINLKATSVDFTSLFRYGLMENFEIRTTLGFNNFNSDSETANSIPDPQGFSLWSVGFRYNLISGEDYKPSFGIQTDLSLNTIDKEYAADEVAPSLTLLHSQALSENLGLTSNWSIAWNGNDNTPVGNYVINLGFPLSDKIGAFVENYGQISNGEIDTRWDTGLGYLVNDDLLLDFSVGYGSNDGLNDWFIDAGISWRTKFK